MRKVLIALMLLAAAGLTLLAVAWREAVSVPVVRRHTLALADWPAGAPPLRLAVLSDIHVGSPAMDAGRLGRIVDQVAALRPDLVVIAGDFISGHAPDSAARLAPALAPLDGLKPRLGVVAALGNHDLWTGEAAVRAALARAGVRVIDNDAIALGPLALGVVGDDYTGSDDVPATLAAMARLPGARMVLTHSPDIATELPGDVGLLVAGHTHCGQIVLPPIGAPASVSRHGNRYRCGVIREGDRTVVVSAGLGTSVLPLRLGAPPDLWMLTLGPRSDESVSRVRAGR